MNYKLKRILLKPFDLLYKISPELTLRILFKLKTGDKLNLEEPKTYNEKIQWLKLYYKDPRIPQYVDKYQVRKYVNNKGLGHILNDLLWEGFNPEDIPFEKLPNKFVIKATHGQGYNIICTDKSKLNYKEIINKLNEWLDAKFFPSYGEWFYGVVRPRILVEEFIGNKENEVPKDYKIFCFNGSPKYIVVDTDRFSNHKRNVYDLNWNLKENYKFGFPNDKLTRKPKQLDQLIKYAQILSDNFPHVRVDFYIINHEIRFGEMTFTNGAGFDEIQPREFNLELGSYINLPVNIEMKRDI